MEDLIPALEYGEWYQPGANVTDTGTLEPGTTPSRIRRQDALQRQAPEHCINLLRRQLRPPVKPPSQHGHEGANDKLDDKFTRDDVGGYLVAGCS